MRSGGGCAQSTAATAAAMATARILVAPSLHTGFLFLSSELSAPMRPRPSLQAGPLL